MTEKHKFVETRIANMKFLHYHTEGPVKIDHRDIILENADKLRILSYTHQYPDGAESICYDIHGYIPLERSFRKRKIYFEELILLMYGLVHTISNAKKCGLMENSFVLDPRRVYLRHDSIQPYLLYLPTDTGVPLREEFMKLLEFLDRAAGPEVSKTRKLLEVIRDIALDDLDLHSITNVVIQTANTKKVAAPKKVPDVRVEEVAKEEPALPPALPPRPMPAPSVLPSAPPASARPLDKQKEQKQGFFARFFGFTIKKTEPDDFLPTIDDRTMIDFTAYGDEDSQPKLYVLEGKVRTTQIAVTNDAFVLGRNRNEVDFCFNGANDKGISRVHAVIIFDGSGYFVSDKGSSGGTFVNGHRLSPGGTAPLKSGDIVSLYTKKLLFEI